MFFYIMLDVFMCKTASKYGYLGFQGQVHITRIYLQQIFTLSASLAIKHAPIYTWSMRGRFIRQEDVRKNTNSVGLIDAS